MSTLVMIGISGILLGVTLHYLMRSLKYKKHGKDKKQISEALVTLLKE